MADNVIETRELTKKFGGFTAVDHLNYPELKLRGSMLVALCIR